MFGINATRDGQLSDPPVIKNLSLKVPGIQAAKSDGKYPRLLFVFVVQMVASAMDVDACDITKQERGNAKLCRARQVAMYLMNVSLACSFKDIGEAFCKDRTTVSHACGVIEELRDIPAFDDRMIELEEILSTVLKMLPGSGDRSDG